MRQVKKEDAIREYGVRYVTALGGLELNLYGEGRLSPSDALAKKLETLSMPHFDGTIKLTEELGAPTKEYHYKDLKDVHSRYETEERARYKKALGDIERLMTDNAALLEQAASSQKFGQQRLKAAFEKAYEKRVMIDEFLGSRLSFKVGTKELNDVLTLPDTIAKTGDTVFVVKHDGKAMPTLSTATVGERDFGAAFFTKADFGVSYEIDTGAAVSARDDNTFFSVDASETKVPSGVIAKGLNKLAFNTKAAAVEYMGQVLDERETGLKAELKKLRAARRQFGNTAP